MLNYCVFFELSANVTSCMTTIENSIGCAAMIGNLSHTNLQETEFACLTTSYQPTTRVILRTHSFSFAYKDPKNKARDNITLLAIYICRGKTYWLSPHFWSTRHYITRNPRRPRPQHQSGCPVPRQEITAK